MAPHNTPSVLEREKNGNWKLPRNGGRPLTQKSDRKGSQHCGFSFFFLLGGGQEYWEFVMFGDSC